MAASRNISILLLALLLAPSVVYCGFHHHQQQQQQQDMVLGWFGGEGEGEGEGEGDEFAMSSEVSRRILATSRYISYNALHRDSTPCSRRGASYYNCRPGAQANPYSRGCSAITRCRS